VKSNKNQARDDFVRYVLLIFTGG